MIDLNKPRARWLIATSIFCFFLTSFVQAQKAITIERIHNDRGNFYVRVDVDRTDRTYAVGDVIKVKVASGKAGDLYLFYTQADGKTVCLFPNKVQRDNRIEARKVITIPAPSADFRLRVSEPVGREVLKAVVIATKAKAKNVKALEKSLGKSLVQNHFTELSENNLESFSKSLDNGDTSFVKAIGGGKAIRVEPKNWAEHHVVITTVKKKVAGTTRPRKYRRVAILIGISKYKDYRIPRLRVCHLDCEKLGETLKKNAGFDDVFTLVNEKATMANIKELIRVKAAKLTKPGDEVLIFWSGHGDSIADVDGDEKDGRDEILIPYDASIARKKETCVTDDAFGRWLLALDGRKIVIVLDACKSGGQATNEKGLKALEKNKVDGFDFLDSEVTRTKDIGQRQAAVLASSRASQSSLVRREGDLSVMTYFLIKKIQSSHGKLSLQDAYKHLKGEVPKYVRAKFTGYSQDPVLIGNEYLEFNFKK